MLAEIAAETIYVSARLGKAALGDRVMEVMGKVLRHEYVPIELQPHAYANVPLPIGFDKTISQPFIVALMTDLLDIRPDETVLEMVLDSAIRRRSSRNWRGKSTASKSSKSWRSKRTDGSADGDTRTLSLKVGNGSLGWPEHAPFDKVIVTAAPRPHPSALDPAAEGGRQNGNSRRLARGATTRPPRERPPRPGDDEGNPASAILTTRGS